MNHEWGQSKIPARKSALTPMPDAEHAVRSFLENAARHYDVLLEPGIRIQPHPIWEEEWAAKHRARKCTSSMIT